MQGIVVLIIVTILLSADTAIAETDGGRSYRAEIGPYVDFLKLPRERPVDYVIRLFKEYDLVILCERIHPEMTQYDFIFELAADQRFRSDVGNVFTEIGSSSYQDRLNRYLEASDSCDSGCISELNEIYRDFYDGGVWEMTNLYMFLKRIHDANRDADSLRKIHVYPSGKAFSYEGMTKKRYDEYDSSNRDSAIAANIIIKYSELKRRNPAAKALVILNFRHGFNRHIGHPDGRLIRNVGGYLFEAFPQKVANVMINTVVSKQTADTVIFSAVQGGRWDAAFAALGNPPMGFDLEASPFGMDHCDYLNFLDHDLTYRDLYTGFVFYNPVGEHRLGFGIPAILEDGFEETLKQRIKELFEKDSTYIAQYIFFLKEFHEFDYSTFDRHFEVRSVKYMVDQEISQWLND
jgi:hypothetical protein